MAACFDIGGSFIKFGASKASGEVSESGRLPNPIDSFDHFVAALRRAIASMGDDSGFVSISLAGIFDPVSGLATIANVPCLNGRRVAADLSDALGVAVRVTNDADCFALAEVHSGAAQGKANVFGVIIGTGIGGGVVIDGRLLRGFGGISGEWGHGPITDPAAGGISDPMPRQVCGCGQTDCLDPVGSARGLERIHLAVSGHRLDSVNITAGWNSGDEACEKTVGIYVEQIARPLSVIVNTLGPELVPAGGGLASETRLLSMIDGRVARWFWPTIVNLWSCPEDIPKVVA